MSVIPSKIATRMRRNYEAGSTVFLRVSGYFSSGEVKLKKRLTVSRVELTSKSSKQETYRINGWNTLNGWTRARARAITGRIFRLSWNKRYKDSQSDCQ